MANIDPTAGKGNPDIHGNNGIVEFPQVGEKIATSWATYGADELNPNESCCSDEDNGGPSTPDIVFPGYGGSASMQAMEGPH